MLKWKPRALSEKDNEEKLIPSRKTFNQKIYLENKTNSENNATLTNPIKMTKGRITSRVKVFETMPGGRFSGSRNMC